MAESPLKGAYLQLWHFGQPWAAERTLQEAVDLCKRFGFAGLGVKALDGLAWMGTIPAQQAFPDALRSVPQIREQRVAVEAAGLGYAIWVNPLHGDRTHLGRQGVLYAQAAEAAGMIWWDSEPYAGFWGANRPPGDARFLLEEFRDVAPDTPCVWQPDPRPARLAELRPDEWRPFMQAYAPQTYWNDFRRPWADVLDEAYEQRAGLPFVPTLPGNAPAAELAGALGWLQGSPPDPGCIVWRMGSAGPAHLAAVRDHPFGAPAPGPDPAGYVFPVEGYRGEVGLHHGSHPGASDLLAPAGTPCRAMGPGRVAGAGTGAISGNYVLYEGDDGRRYFYAHGDRAPAVGTGHRVEAGSYFFGVGNTGNASHAEPHLHIGIGRDILDGDGPAGGAGSDFDAVGFLRAVLAAEQPAPEPEPEPHPEPTPEPVPVYARLLERRICVCGYRLERDADPTRWRVLAAGNPAHAHRLHLDDEEAS